MKNKLYSKWWFWLIILVIVIILCFTAILAVSINKATSGISGISLQIQDIYNDTIIYNSAGNSKLIIELKHFDINNHSKQFADIISIIKNNLDTDLISYKELIIITLKDDEEENNQLILYTRYSLPDFKELESENYINYVNYTNLYNLLVETNNDYINLYNTIGK